MTEQDLPKEVNFSNFKKIKLIGRGDVGRVYLANLIGTNKYFAMKVLLKEQMVARNKMKRVSAEREILTTVKHPFLAHLYWSFESKYCFYFVMEYCAGGEFFRTLMKQPGKCFPEKTAKFYASEVLIALEYLHLQGIMYRDLKPENILLHETGHIVLADFDLSKQVNEEDLNSFLTAKYSKGKAFTDSTTKESTNSFVGTAEYLAPEVITGYGHTGSVDWWTFGIFIYEMLYGTTPFVSSNREQTFSKILDGFLSFPKGHRYPVSNPAKDLIKKLLCSDPNKRLGSKSGAEEIKKHDFFKDVKFQLIRNEKPPIIPKFTGPEDTSHFRNIQDDKIIDKLEQQELNEINNNTQTNK